MAPSSSQSSSGLTLVGVTSKFFSEYSGSTPKKCKIIDAYLAYIMITGIVQVGGVTPVLAVNHRVTKL